MDRDSPDTATPEDPGSRAGAAPVATTGAATDDAAVVAPVRRKQVSRSSTRNALEWVAVIVGAVVVALLIKTFVAQAFRIPSDSMLPTLQEQDRVLVNKLSYDVHEINRGDVVVFERPEALPAAPGDPEDLIKRVIGLPGDELLARDGTLYVNQRELIEPYLAEGTFTFGLDDPVTVGEGEIFVMGDNRENSSDSRVFGPISEDSVIGRAFSVMWPPARIGAL